MPNPSKIANPRVPLLLPYPGGADWADAWTRMVEGWFEWQVAMWQPLMDAQAEWLRQWSEQSGWPVSQGVPVRGAEQLA